jgi:AhpD family alkylhydroperoxidase
MKPRMNFYQVAPDTINALSALEKQVQASGLERSLIELVKTRASQINGCAFCINMHTADARQHGESEARLYLLNAWRESPVYTDRERAALAWTEAVTLISETHAPDDLYEEVRRHFSEAETVNLTMLIATINAWNRLAISFRAVPQVKVRVSAA